MYEQSSNSAHMILPTTPMIWQNETQALHSVHQLSKLLLVVILILSIATIIAGYFISKMVSVPILNITKAMNALAKGQYPEIPYQNKKDEIGQMSAALCIFKSNTLENCRR